MDSVCSAGYADLTLWYVVALARNGMTTLAVQFLERIYETMEGGSPKNTFRASSANGSTEDRSPTAACISPWTSAKYLWAWPNRRWLDGYRTSGRPHLAR